MPFSRVRVIDKRVFRPVPRIATAATTAAAPVFGNPRPRPRPRPRPGPRHRVAGAVRALHPSLPACAQAEAGGAPKESAEGEADDGVISGLVQKVVEQVTGVGISVEEARSRNQPKPRWISALWGKKGRKPDTFYSVFLED